MEYYLGHKITSRNIKSPFRDDEHPTCGFYYGKSGRLYLHDFGTEEHFDCIEIVRKKFNLSFNKTIDKIIEDENKFNIVEKADINQDKHLEWIPGEGNYEYFNKLGIRNSTLKKFGVYTARAIYVDETLFWRSTEKNPIFVYQFLSGGFKAYKPLTKDKENKWKSNCTIRDIQGYHQLPAYGKVLTITSSLKDVMVLHEMGFPAIAFSSEGISTKGKNGDFVKEIIAHLRTRFEEIVLFLDNDEPGIKYTIRISKELDLKSITLPEKSPKDISDCVALLGMAKSKRLLKKLLSKTFKIKDNGSFEDIINSSLSSDSGSISEIFTTPGQYAEAA